jgi:hypothetical protein
MARLYDLYCQYQIQFVFVCCNFHLIPFWEHYGSIRIDKNILDPSCGPGANLVMLVDNIQHLKKVGSPLYRKGRKRIGLNNKASDWFYSEFSHEMKTTVHSRFVTEDDLWTIICQYLGDIPNHKISMLKDLSVLETKLFLHSCSTIVHCRAREYITDAGNISQEFIILLSGIAHSSLQGSILPGHYCGSNGLIDRTTHDSNVIALEDTNILVLSFYNFSNFRKRHHDIACKILHNIKID